MAPLSLPDLIGVSVADSRCLLTPDQLNTLGTIIIRRLPRDAESICFLGGSLSDLAPANPTSRVVPLGTMLGADPFLVLAGTRGTLALLAAPAPQGYHTRLFTDPDRVDRAALVLSQFSDELYLLDAHADPEAHHALIVTLVFALATHPTFESLPLADLLPDTQSWLRIAQTLSTHRDSSSLLTLPPIQQMIRASAGTGAILGRIQGQGAQTTIETLATTEGLHGANMTLPPQVIQGLMNTRRPRSITAQDVTIRGTTQWEQTSALTLVAVATDESVDALLLVASKRPLAANARATLHGLGIMLAHAMAKMATAAAAPPTSITTSLARRASARTSRTAPPSTTLDLSFLPLMKYLRDGVLLVDSRGRLLAYNDAAAQMLGLLPEEVGQPLTASSAHILVPILTNALLGDFADQEPLDLPTGKAAVTVLSMHGDSWGFVLYGHELVTADGSSPEAPRPRKPRDYSESLLAGFSNTVRAPLQALRELITRVPAAGSLNEHQAHLIGQVVKLNSELTLMVNDLLTLGQIRLEAAESIAPLRLDMLVEAAVGTRYAEFGRRGQQVEVEIPPEGVRIVASEDGVGRVIGALLDNAIAYSPPGAQINVRLSQQGNEVVVEVQDTGIGLAKDEQEQVFDPFYRAPGAEELGVHGRGLGLTIAKAVVDHHGGNIWVTSMPGQGSTFTFTLPLEPTIDVMDTA